MKFLLILRFILCNDNSCVQNIERIEFDNSMLCYDAGTHIAMQNSYEPNKRVWWACVQTKREEEKKK